MGSFHNHNKFFAFRRLRKIGLQFALVFASILLCLPAFAQLNLGRITGTVTDQTGGVIVNASVSVIDVTRGTTRNLMTDQAGEYNAPSLDPGTYTVRATATGFETLERQNVLVEVGGSLRVDLTLQPGEQNQTVTVSEALPIINATNAALGGTVTTEALADLPLNGRDITKLLDYVPGSVSTDGKFFDFNGARQYGQVFMFDGIDEFNPYATGPIVGGTSGFAEATVLPLDSVQEANIITNPPAEYGWKYGGIINVGLKAGTNTIHGTAFALGRDNALEAKPAFLLPTQPKPSDFLEQFGATLGGPLKKDKLFYFVAYEGQRYSVASTAVYQEPSALSGAGKSSSIPDAITDILTNPANTTHIAPSALSLDLAGCPTTAPYTPCTGGIFQNPTNLANVPGAIPQTGGSNNGTVKIDYHLNDKNTINGEYFYGLGTSDQGNTTNQLYWRTAKFTRAQLARIVWVNTPNSSWLNEARFGIDREYQTGSPAECTQSFGQPNYATAYDFVIQPVAPPLCGFPQLSISGFTTLGTTETSGGPSDVTWTTYAGIDAVSYTHGAHQLKFGFEIHASTFSGSTKLNYIHGRLTVGSVSAFTGATALEDFLTGTIGQSQVLVGSPLITSDFNRYATFFQDDWRIKRNVTLNLGLRWEIVPAITGNNQLGSFSPTQGLEQVGQQIKSLYPTDYKDFGPRLGVVWDTTGKGTTVVRAGGSVQYTIQPINSFLSPAQGAAVNIIPTGFKLYGPTGNLLPSPGTLQTANLVGTGNALVNWTPGVPVFNTNPSLLACGNGLGVSNPNNPISGTNVANPQPCNIQPLSQNFTPGYVVTWTTGIQHAITNNISLQVGYVGTKGLNLSENVDVNQPLPGIVNSKTLLTEQLRRPYLAQFPYLGQVMTFTNGAYSLYNALQADLKIRATHGLTASVAYTYSHTNDNADGEYGSYFENNTNPKADYGPAGFDFHNVLTLSFTYEIPGVKVPGQLLQGWELNSVLSVLGPQPWSPVDTTDDISGTGELRDRWSILGNPANIRSGLAPIPCYGITGSKFGASPCTTVNTPTGCTTSSSITSATQALACVQSLPAPCISAAMSEATNINAQSGVTATTANSTGPWSLASFGCYYENGTAIVPPAQGTFGNMSQNMLRNGLPFREWDMSLGKSWTFRERYKVLFRAEAFNITNKPIFSTPTSNPASPTTFGAATTLNNSTDPVLGEGGPREFNLSLRITF